MYIFENCLNIWYNIAIYLIKSFSLRKDKFEHHHRPSSHRFWLPAAGGQAELQVPAPRSSHTSSVRMPSPWQPQGSPQHHSCRSFRALHWLAPAERRSLWGWLRDRTDAGASVGCTGVRICAGTPDTGAGVGRRAGVCADAGGCAGWSGRGTAYRHTAARLSEDADVSSGYCCCWNACYTPAHETRHISLISHLFLLENN